MHRRLIATAVFAVLGAALVAPLHAQNGQHPHYRYKWVDKSGLPHFSDSLTDAAIRNGYDVVNNQGMVVQHVPRPLTRAERKAAQARQQAATEAAHKRAQQQADDRQMLAAYPTEQAFAAAQQADVQALEDNIHTTRMNLRSQEQNLSDLLAHAANLQAGGEKVPPALARRIATQRDAVTSQRSTLEQQQKQVAQARKDAAARIAHYRALKAQQQAQMDGDDGS